MKSMGPFLSGGRSGSASRGFWLCMCIVLATIQCSNAASTDPALVGTWHTTTFIEGRLWTFTFDITETEQYRVTSVTTDGKLRAKNGRWSLVASPHYSDGGSYTFSGSDAVSITGKLGTATWKRVETGDTSSGTRVDPALIGTWKLETEIDGKQWTLMWTMRGAGTYKVSAFTEDGTYEAQNGRWKSVSTSGHTEKGTYTLKSKDSLWITGPKGSGSWTRVNRAPGPSPKKDTLAKKEAKRHYQKGKEYVQKKKWDQAIVEFNKAIELNPKFSVVFFSRGNVYSEKGHHDKAIADFTRFIDMKPKDARAYYNRGNGHFAIGQYDEAIADFTKTVELNPNIAHAYDNRGSVYDELGQYEKAMADFERALQVDPKHANAKRHLELAQERKRGPNWAGDEIDNFIIRINKRSKGATFKETTIPDPKTKAISAQKVTKSVSVRPAVTIEGGGYLSKKEDGETCLWPDSKPKGPCRPSPPNIMIDLTQIDPASIKILGPSWSREQVHHYEGWNVGFKCRDHAHCYGEKGKDGWILCRDRAGCEAMAKDLRALITLAKKTWKR